MCNLKQTPQSNWWSNDSTPLCDTAGLGMVLWPQQPPERGVETCSLPRKGMLQYLPFLLHDQLPVAVESTQLKPLLHRRGWWVMSEPPPSLPRCPTWNHPRERMEGFCGRAWCVLPEVWWESAAEMLHLHHLSANRVGTGQQESLSCPIQGGSPPPPSAGT